MVRDYVESLTGADASSATVVINPEVGGGLDEQARAAREATAAADRATREAAAQSRKSARASCWRLGPPVAISPRSSGCRRSDIATS